MDMWRAFGTSTRRNAPQAATLFDKFHVLRHLGKALDTIRKREYGRLQGKPRTFIKGRKYIDLRCYFATTAIMCSGMPRRAHA